MSGLSWLTAQPIAHRGLHEAGKGIIENTASAIAAAAQAGYGIEVDLQLAADGEAMVFHDRTLDRLTEESGPLVERRSGNLKQIAFKGSGDRMLMLGELLALVDGRVPLLLEVKSQWDAVGPLEERISQMVQSYRGPVAVMSFDPRSVAAFIHYAPGLPRGIVAERFRDLDYWSKLTARQRFVMRHLLHFNRTKPHFIAYDIHGLASAAPLIARYMFGIPLLTWTVRTPAERRRARWFADAMIFEGFRP